MRSHAEIIRQRRAVQVARDLKTVGVEVTPGAPQRWVERNSIPGEYWAPLVDLEIATLDELASAADKRTQDAAA